MKAKPPCPLCHALGREDGTCSACELQRSIKRALLLGWLAYTVLSTAGAVACKLYFG